MKKILIVIIMIGLGYLGWKAIQTKPDTTVPQATVSEQLNTEEPVGGETPSVGRVRPVNNDAVRITFKGFGPGKEHNGSFGTLSSALELDEAGSMTGTVSVTVSSLVTDTEKLTSHLKSKDFFDVAVYPTATFTLTGIANGKASGSMTIRGITKAISFPVSYSDTANAYSAKFTLNMKDFGINQTFANEVIELSVVVPLS